MNIPDMNILDGLVLVTTDKNGLLQKGNRYTAENVIRDSVIVVGKDGVTTLLAPGEYQWCSEADRKRYEKPIIKVWKLGFDGNSCALLTFAEVIETLTTDFECHDPGDGVITLELVRMTREEFANLGDFEGW